MNPEDFWAIHIATLRVYTWQLGIVRTTLKANSIEKLAKCPVTTATHATAWGKIEHLKLTLKCVILSQRVVRFGCDHWTGVSCLTFWSFLEQDAPTLKGKLMLYVTIPVGDSCLNWPPTLSTWAHQASLYYTKSPIFSKVSLSFHWENTGGLTHSQS